MSAQFEFYSNDNIPLLAFHGDISIPAKWEAATRLVRRWRGMRKPIRVMYYGDLDPKGIQIPESAERDVRQMMTQDLWRRIYRERGWTASRDNAEWLAEATELWDAFTFERIGLNEDQVDQYGIQENPERPGTYQWEGVDDDAAQELIGLANEVVDTVAFDDVAAREDSVTDQFRAYMQDFTIEDDEEKR